jgi:DNA-binding GntR family transcriptional regulator
MDLSGTGKAGFLSRRESHRRAHRTGRAAARHAAARERDLAVQYGVALGTARRAIRNLSERQPVITLPAKGTYVRAPKKGEGHDGAG